MCTLRRMVSPPIASPGTDPSHDTPTRRPVNWRSVSLGLLGVLFICILTPYNNYVLSNTDFIGSHLPASLLVFFFVFVLLVNGLLWRFAPRRALGGGELAVALAMALVSCALPSNGLMRYLPGHLVSFFSTAAVDNDSATILRQLDLPDWLWPRMAADDPVERAMDPVVRDFVSRMHLPDDRFVTRFAAVPWQSWIVPAIAWGIFFFALCGAVLFLALIFRRQWVENEKLAFPLASVYLSLIEPPERGRFLNSLLRNRLFWWAFAGVFLLHGFNALHVYDPQHWPVIPISYDLRDILANPPWRFTHYNFQVSGIYFTVVGIMIFVQGRIAFSLWFFYVVMQVVRMGYGTYQLTYTGAMQADHMLGGLVAVAVMILWVARRHLALIAVHMFRRPRPGEAGGRYLPDAVSGWGFVACTAILIAWMTAAGTTLVGAVVIIGMILMAFIVLARIVAETGLIYVQVGVAIDRVWLLSADIGGAAGRTGLGNIFFSNWFFGMFLNDTRESLPVYATHAVRIADDRAYANERNWRRAVPFVAVLVLAIVVAFAASGASSLYIHYSYEYPLDNSDARVGQWGSMTMPATMALGWTKGYLPPRAGPSEPHSRVGHFVGAGLFTGFLGTMNLRFAAWPLHPIGFVIANTWGLHQIWFSIFIGWLAKGLIVRYGGAGLYRTIRPLFIGLIFGEAAAMAFWLCISLALSSIGETYHAIQILPQ